MSYGSFLYETADPFLLSVLFNSVDFLLFFPVAVAVYFAVPRKLRYIVLLNIPVWRSHLFR